MQGYKRSGPKRTFTDEAWAFIREHITEIVSDAELDQLEEMTLKRAEEWLKDFERPLVCWSGGKDSQVLLHLMHRIGLREAIGVFTHPDLEYPTAMRWYNENRPDGCEFVITHHDLTWLSKHPDMLFPTTNAGASRAYQIIQQVHYDRYCREHEFDVVILGRRRKDGNFCPSEPYAPKGGIYRANVIYDWDHEQTYAYMARYNLPLAPIYDWPDGFLEGTHPWCFRLSRKHHGYSEKETWQVIYDIDPDIIDLARPFFPVAQEVWNGNGNV